jgi:2-polyprenyl-3-methyl-5-hydroxy-6-metoxy-1,4-benzoquinol methylase
MPEYRLHRDPASSHQQIARIVRALGRSPVLDVGAAHGMLGLLLHDSGLTLDAIEPNQQWAGRARPFYRSVLAAPVESAPLPARAYPVLVCADVLEHTVDPAGVLRHLRSAATPDAVFVVSLPNVAHVAIRAMLLCGRFPKMDRGILDRTHLHFFTRETAEDLLRATGLRVRRASATGVPLDEIWPRGEGRLPFTIAMRLQHGALRLAPRLFGFQWVFVAEAGIGVS